MSMIRSARGELIDTALHAIKAQLAQRPVPKPVAARQAEIEEREGVKTTLALPPDVVITTEPVITAELSDMLAAAEESTVQEVKSKKR